MPWITRADVLINTDDKLHGRQALSEVDALMRQTGAVVFHPLIDEARAAYAAQFKELWDPEAEREAASESFAQLDRNGPC